MDLGLLEYALWVTLGLWAALFAGHPIARSAGVALIILAVLKAFTEKADTAPRKDGDREPGARETGPGEQATAAGPEREPPASVLEGEDPGPAPEPAESRRPRKRIL